jgi:DUF4097 and DUF4098 domain-containing protein YvlB
VPATLAAILTLGGPPLHAQVVGRGDEDDADWVDRCRDHDWDDRRVFCTVRVVGMRATGRPIAVDGNENGGVEVLGWDRDSIEIHARISTRARSEDEARQLAERIQVRVTDDPIRADGPATGFGRSWAVSYVIYAPRKSDLSLETHNGPIGVHAVTGRMELRAVNGPITLRQLAGDVRARTTNGPISVSLDGARWQGTGLDAQTTNGPVTISVPEGYSAHLEAGTENGPMSVGFPVTVQGRIGRRISADLGGGGPTVRAVTTNGPVTLRRG